MKRTPALALAITSPLIVGEAAAAFIEDSKASITLKNIYYNQDTRNQSRSRDEEWGQGFLFNFQSGYTEGTVGFGLDFIAQYAIRLDSGGKLDKSGATRRPGTSFPLESDGSAKSDFGRVGVTGKIRYAKTEARFGTLRPKIPVLISNSARVLPQLFEGIQLTSKDIDNLSLIAGRLEHSTQRNSANSHGMSIAGSNTGGSSQEENGKYSNEFYYAGADYQATKDLKLQYYFGQLRDFYKQHFVGAIHNWQLPVGKLKTDLRYFYSDSDGENASASGRAEGYLSTGYYGNGVTSGEVDNSLWSALFTYSLMGHSMGLGYQKISGNSDFPHINLGAGRTLHLITNAQIGKFEKAGENTWVAKYSYDFAEIGIPGLKTSLAYFSGDDIDADGSDKREWERNFRVDYKFQAGTLKGLGLTYRNATARGNDSRDRDENRVIVSYTLPLF